MNAIIFLYILSCALFYKFCSAVGRPAFVTKNFGPKPLWNATHVDVLKKDVLLNYDKFARPAQHNITTNVKIALSIFYIEVNEFKSTIRLNTWIKLEWTDEKLKWNPNVYGGIKIANFADHEIWQPDIVLYNSASGNAASHYGGTHCVVYANGNIVWVPPAQLTALCNFNLRYWPFDTQTCSLTFGSWSYDGNAINLTSIDDMSIDLSGYLTDSEWIVQSTGVLNKIDEDWVHKCCNEPYHKVTFEIVISRRSDSYKALLVAPAFVIIVYTLISFWLPPQAGEKLILNGCSLIVISVFMLYFAQKIPSMGMNTPLVVLFYSGSFYVVCFSVIGSVLVIWLSRSKHLRPLPWIIKQPLTGCFGKMLGLCHYIEQTSLGSQTATAEEMSDHQVTEVDDNESSDQSGMMYFTPKAQTQNDWILLAVAIDRLSFVVYCVLFMVLAFIYSV